jgi:hypothetical protein
MKVTVRKRFRDIETRQIMKVGEVVEYDDERAHELARGRFVTIVGDEILTEEDEAPTGDDNNTDKGSQADTDNPEKEEVMAEQIEKAETSHVAKPETDKPNKLGRKTKK